MQGNDDEVYEDSEGEVIETRPSDWWNAPLPESRTRLTSKLRNEVISLAGGLECLINRSPGWRGAIDICYLVPRDWSSKRLARLQYAWGRPFSPHNRWNLFLATIHYRIVFRDSWVLVPKLDTVLKIEEKMRAELDKRTLLGITGPWPDFRSKEWFPIRKNERFAYDFISFADLGGIPRINPGDEQLEPDERFSIYVWPYRDFPTIYSHVHPYMAIVNAVPKLKQHSEEFNDDGPKAQLYKALLFIYDTWMTCIDDESQLGSEASGPSIPPQSKFDRRDPALKADSPEPRRWELDVRSGPPELSREDFHGWVDGANGAREREEISLVHNPPEIVENYGAEPTRVPYNEDWHNWGSEFDGQDLPTRRRGVLSSNDWARIEEGVLLTGRDHE